MRHEAAGITTELFPKTFSHSGIDMTLNYHFEPGNPRDGITLNIPIYALNQLDAQRCEWLVLGMLKEKTQLLIKSLPQRIRRNCVPLPEYSAGFVDRILEKNAFGSGPLVEALIEDIRSETNAVAKTDDFRLETLPSHLFMNFRVVDEHGRMLEMSRNLSALQAEFSHEARSSFQQLAENRLTGFQKRIQRKRLLQQRSPAPEQWTSLLKESRHGTLNHYLNCLKLPGANRRSSGILLWLIKKHIVKSRFSMNPHWQNKCTMRACVVSLPCN